ncbi:hypothetical protein BC628DRAFT_22394 [Trametes gibbosa]|nr:hypothetical protein BC628DRAFT_22394 [Trametes gibbosa]
MGMWIIFGMWMGMWMGMWTRTSLSQLSNIPSSHILNRRTRSLRIRAASLRVSPPNNQSPLKQYATARVAHAPRLRSSPPRKNSQRKKANFDDLILQEMGRRVHFLPIEDFFERFAPSGSDSDIALEAQSRRVAQVGEEAAEKILKVDLETKMYPILCAAFAQVLKGTKHIVVDTHQETRISPAGP